MSHQAISLTTYLDQQFQTLYQSRGRSDYTNNGTIGLFKQCLIDEGFDSEAVEEELEADMEDCGFLEFDSNFPVDGGVEIQNDDDMKEYIWNVLLQFLSEYRSAKSNPIQIPSKSSNPPPDSSPNNHHLQSVDSPSTKQSKSVAVPQSNHFNVNIPSVPSNNNTPHRPLVSNPQPTKPTSIPIPLVNDNRTIVVSMCRKLQSLYKSQGRNYTVNANGEGLFEVFCDENQFDDENIVDDLNPEEMEESMLVEFDEDFVFKGTEEERNQYIFKMLYKIYQEVINPKGTGPMERLNTAMSRYYANHNAPYNNEIENFCVEYTIDEIEQLEDNKEELIDTHLLLNFPFKLGCDQWPKRLKRHFIWKQIENFAANRHPGSGLPQELHALNLMKTLFDSVTTKDFNQTRRRYESQCGAIWKQQMGTDNGFIVALCIGDKYKFPFLQLFVDDFLCEKANRQKYEDGLRVAEWAETNNYMKTLKKIWVNLKVDQNLDFNQSAFEIMKAAVSSWSKRCVPFWKAPLQKLDISMEMVLDVWEKQVDFLVNFNRLFPSFEHTVCPTHLDVIVVVDEEKVIPDVQYPDDKFKSKSSSDEYDFKKESGPDFPENIGENLSRNNLDYISCELPKRPQLWRPYDVFKDLLLNKCGSDEYGSEFHPLHKRRLNVIADFRKKRKTLWMFFPPNDCCQWPYEAVNEIAVNASKTCIFPGYHYNDNLKKKKRGSNHPKNDGTITIGNAKPNVIVFSILYRESDCVQCHINWNQQRHRFCPREKKETENVLNEIFKQKGVSQEFERIMRKSKEMIKDSAFEFTRKLAHCHFN